MEAVWGWIPIVVGTILFILGPVLWDYERRKDDWRLSDAKKAALMSALKASQFKFQLWFFPLNSEPLANRYSYDLLSVFSASGWSYGFASPNWVVPTNIVGLYLATCTGQSDPSDQVLELRRVFGSSGIVLNPTIQAEEALEHLGCPLGLIVGSPPSPYQR